MNKVIRQTIASLSLTLCMSNISMAQLPQNLISKNKNMDNHSIHYQNIKVNGLNIFYRESGDVTKPTLLLLHGYPTSSHMFRNLIPILSKDYHIIAPDLPGFGFSDAPNHNKFNYTFDNLAKTMKEFIDHLKMKNISV